LGRRKVLQGRQGTATTQYMYSKGFQWAYILKSSYEASSSCTSSP
jgi:hypothetical protein